MRDDELRLLIAKYYEGETSADEEDCIYDELSKGDRSDEFESEWALFQLLEENKNEEPSEGFESKLNVELSRLSKAKRRTLNRFSLIGVAASLLLLVFFIFDGFWASNEYEIAEEETIQINLSDGSTVWLNKNSKLKYPEDFREDIRTVQLDGEGYFEVNPNAGWPFVIEAGHSKIKVLGTSFSVRNHDDGPQEVAVNSGKVSFQVSDAKFILLEANEIGIYDNIELTKSVITSDNQFAWKNKRLQFKGKPLESVILDLERYFDTQIVIENNHLLSCSFQGLSRTLH